MNRNLKIISIIITTIILSIFAISCRSDIFFSLGAVKTLCYFMRSPVYSSREQVDSIISKQLNKEQIHFIILYGSKRQYHASGIYFDNKGLPLPLHGCSPILPDRKIQDTVIIVEDASLLNRDTLQLFDLIQPLTDKNYQAFDRTILAKYQYVVLIDKLIGGKLERHTIDKVKMMTNIDSVLFIFRARDSIRN